MSFLRLGVASAIFDDDGRILLSLRGDLHVWNLPTGRLDAHEPIEQAAAREAYEETGLHVNIERPIGLYYLEASQRLNVLFSGFALKGEPLAHTEEARANRFFWRTDIPQETFGTWMIADAVDEHLRALHITRTPAAEMRTIRRKLAWRYVKNLLNGKPEPRHVRFEVRAVGIVWDAQAKQILTLPQRRWRQLMSVVCTGKVAPWEALQAHVRRYVPAPLTWEWVGIWQSTETNTLDFVFAATAPPDLHEPLAQAEWTNAQNVALIGRETLYMQYVTPNYKNERVWCIYEDATQPLAKISQGDGDAQ